MVLAVHSPYIVHTSESLNENDMVHFAGLQVGGAMYGQQHKLTVV